MSFGHSEGLVVEIRDWRIRHDSLAINPMCGEPVPKPTVTQLDRFEEETGFWLPRSYREYIQVFGPGRLFADWDIAGLGYGPSWYFDLHGMQANMVPEERWIRRYPDAHEYAVYRIVEDKRVIRIASSFRGFVEDAALDRDA